MTPQATFEELVTRELDVLYDGAQLLTGEDARAEALVLSVVVDASRRYERGVDGFTFRKWIVSQLVQRYLDHLFEIGELPDPAAQSPIGDRAESPVPDEAQMSHLLNNLASLDDAAPDELGTVVRRAMEALPVHLRAALWLVDMLEFTYAEAANTADLTLRELQDWLYRARRELQARLVLSLRDGACGRRSATGTSEGFGVH
jgi:DNA-directed RNA polymerase specialized sigma24 family protein